MPKLNNDFVRSHFPAFSEPSLEGFAFFENAGGSYACQPVIDKLISYYQKTKVQPYAPYPAAQEAGQMMDRSWESLAAYLNVKPSEVHFGPSTSQNTFNLSRAFAGLLKPGDEIIVTNQDHEANSGVWRRLEKDGFVIREWSVDPETASLETTALLNLLSERTRLVVFPHCSNVVANINPVAEICELVHRAGAWVLVDGVSYAPHGFPDIKALGADIYLCSLYKCYGPHQGVMVIRDALNEVLPHQSHFFTQHMPSYRMNVAGYDHAQVACASGVTDYYDAIYGHHFSGEVAPFERSAAVHRLFRDHEVSLSALFLEFLSSRNDVRLLGSNQPEARSPTFALQLLDKDPKQVATSLAEEGVMASASHFFAYRLLEKMGIDPETGVLRLSLVHYNNESDIKKLTAALDRVL